ncbi:unknown [Prevotella sp. CAG:873]|nr:unknown [Prevotella sp. CAG:873]
MFVVYIIYQPKYIRQHNGDHRCKKRDACEKIVSVFCCLGRIRTLTGGTRIRRATITPQGKVSCHFDVAKVRTFFEPTNVFLLFLEKKGV